MTGRAACGSCGRPMSAVAVRCPHCGAFQARGSSKPQSDARAAGSAVGAPVNPSPSPPTREPVRVSSEEARALLAVSEVQSGRDLEEPEHEPGPFAAILLPHPRSSGATRAAEIALTVLGAPLIAASLVGLAVMYLRAARWGGTLRGYARGVRAGAVVTGMLLLASVLGAAGLATTTIVVAVALQTIALLARAAVRSAAKRRRAAAYDLTR